MLAPIARITLVAGLLAGLAGEASAQLNNAGGGGGAGAGGNLFGSGQSRFGSALNSGFGAGAGQLGQTGQLGGFGSNALTLNQQAGQNGNFVGRTGEDTGAVFEALNRSGNEFLNRLDRSMNSRNRGRGQNQAVDSRPPIRVNLRLGFRPPAAPPRNLAAPTAQRLNTLLDSKGFPAGTTVNNGIAVLVGEVASEGDRLMLEQLAKLEPGISRVDNRLTVRAEVIERPGFAAPPLAPGN